MARNEDQLLDNFIYYVMTQTERGLHGQDAGEMAESLRGIQQACSEIRRQRLTLVSPALPSQPGFPAKLQA